MIDEHFWDMEQVREYNETFTDIATNSNSRFMLAVSINPNGSRFLISQLTRLQQIDELQKMIEELTRQN